MFSYVKSLLRCKFFLKKANFFGICKIKAYLCIKKKTANQKTNTE